MAASAPDPKVFLADKGYDSDRVRADIESRGGIPVIPMRKGRNVQVAIDDFIYALSVRPGTI